MKVTIKKTVDIVVDIPDHRVKDFFGENCSEMDFITWADNNMYLSCPEEVFGTIKNINNIIFSKPENLGKAVEDFNKADLEEIINEYNNNSASFNESCLLESELLEDVLIFYFEMRRLNLLEGKVLTNERHE